MFNEMYYIGGFFATAEMLKLLRENPEMTPLQAMHDALKALRAKLNELQAEADADFDKRYPGMRATIDAMREVQEQWKEAFDKIN